MIKGLTELRRFTRAGRIRIGEKLPTARGGTRPARLDYFRFLPDDQAEAARFAGLYGDRPARLPVVFVSDHIDHAFPQAYRCYGGDTLLCKGDGATARRTLPKAEAAIVECPGPWACAFALERGADDRPGCKAVGSLFVALPDLGHLRPYQVDTASKESLIRLNTAIDLLRRLAGGLAFVRVDLILSSAQTRTAEGRPVDFFALDLIVPPTPSRLHPAAPAAQAAPGAVSPAHPEIDPAALEIESGELDDLESESVDPETGEITAGDDGAGLDDDPLVLATAEASRVGPRGLRAMLEAARRHGWNRARLLDALRERGARNDTTKKSEAPEWRNAGASNAKCVNEQYSHK